MGLNQNHSKEKRLARIACPIPKGRSFPLTLMGLNQKYSKEKRLARIACPIPKGLNIGNRG